MFVKLCIENQLQVEDLFDHCCYLMTVTIIACAAALILPYLGVLLPCDTQPLECCSLPVDPRCASLPGHQLRR